MNSEEFEVVVNDMLTLSREVLTTKNAAYNPDADKLETFKIAAGFTGETPSQALWGMAVKHLVAVKKMIDSDAFYPPEVWNEKLGDSINYFLLLRALVVDEDREPGQRDAKMTIINNSTADYIPDPSIAHDMQVHATE